jgi:hypothetical protein
MEESSSRSSSMSDNDIPSNQEIYQIYINIRDTSFLALLNVLGLAIFNAIFSSAIIVIMYDTLPEVFNPNTKLLGESFVNISKIIITLQILFPFSTIPMFLLESIIDDSGENIVPYIGFMNNYRYNVQYANIFFKFGIICVSQVWYCYVSASFLYLGLWEEAVFTLTIVCLLIMGMIYYQTKYLKDTLIHIREGVDIDMYSLISLPDKLFLEMILNQ